VPEQRHSFPPAPEQYSNQAAATEATPALLVWAEPAVVARRLDRVLAVRRVLLAGVH
jgi:hypothetical protein